MHPPTSDKIAKIDNSFILNAQYRLTAKEQKILYYLIAHLDPKNSKEFHSITVPIREIEDILREKGTKYGSFYEDIDRICKSLIRKEITFPSKFTLNSKRLNGYISWFQSIMPVEDDKGNLCIEFSFSNKMSPFLLQLHHYVNIGVLEVVPMQNAHAIRMYSIFKSERDRLRGVVNVITLTYSIEELKAMLGISDKYKGQLIDFKVNVLDKVRDEINESCPTMFVEYKYVKTQRKVTGVTFSVYERKNESKTSPKTLKTKEIVESKEDAPVKNTKNYKPTDTEIDTLTRAKLGAYKLLIEYGVFEGIAFKQIIPKIKGSEFEGYEDKFIEYAIKHFDKTAVQNTTKELRASTFVTWWTKNKVFNEGDAWADILEKVVKFKKEQAHKDPTAFQNRAIAKNMTNRAFEEYYNALDLE
jgi:Initiator Replication protein